MGWLKNLWEEYKADKNRLPIGISFASAVISFVGTLVVIAGLIWGVYWARAQDDKADARESAQEEKADARAIAQEKKDADRTIAYETQIARFVGEFNNQIKRLVSEQKQQIGELQKTHKADIETLTEEYAKIVSEEISDLETEMSSSVERNDEMVLDETDRKILASHASDKNVEQAHEDAYKKALDEGREGGYIFEINQALGGLGYGVFRTDEFWVKVGSLLTDEEKEDIDLCFDLYFKSKEKSAKRKDGFADPNTQQEIFFFLLAESGIGRITEPPKRQISYWASYREQKIEVLSPYAKLSAVIGRIGDNMSSYE